MSLYVDNQLAEDCFCRWSDSIVKLTFVRIVRIVKMHMYFSVIRELALKLMFLGKFKIV